jgi:hypothetical protein
MGYPLMAGPPGRASSTVGRTSEAEDPGWDVYNDFNNKGPKYGDAYGAGLAALKDDSACVSISTLGLKDLVCLQGF